jgi:hypothetical protein
MSARAAAVWSLATLFAAPTGAQEGFPLDGTWRGTRGSGADERAVVIVMKWDGKTIDGTIDPGPASVPFASAALEPRDWTVRIEARRTDGTPISIEARLDKIGSYNRTLAGTWREAGVEQAFAATRQ